MEIREEEFDRAIAGLTKAMESGFQGVYLRLDKVNGRLDRHDEEIQDLQIERAFQKGKLESQGEDGKPALTRREARILWGIAAAVISLATWWFAKQ